MRFLLKLVTVICIVLTLAGCNNIIESRVESISGSGNIVTIEQDVTAFSRIQIYLGADLDLTQGGSGSLSIEADDNIMQYIDTKIQDGSLIVTKPDHINLSPTQPIQLHVTFSTLNSIEIFGSSAITAEDLDLERLMISFSGSGSTRLTGAIGNQTIVVRGMAIINNSDLVSQQVSVDISGNGTIEINAEETLDIKVAGMGNIHYRGNPTITQNISGTATITQQQ